MSLQNRIQCLRNLKEIGYQIGAGFMVHSPYQTPEILAEDLLFLKELDPHMVGIGPFIPHHDTQFKNEPAGTVEETTLMLSLIRLLLPTCLLPATTALGTIDPVGREKDLMPALMLPCQTYHLLLLEKNMNFMTIKYVQEMRQQNVATASKIE